MRHAYSDALVAIAALVCEGKASMQTFEPA